MTAPVATPENWSPTVRQALTRTGLDVLVMARVINSALAEDFADGPDVTTTATVPVDAAAAAALVPREIGILAGGAIALAVFETVVGGPVDGELQADGTDLIPGRPALTVKGPTAGLLSAERTALNLVSHLSGIATATRAWVDAVAGTKAKIRDTRKTLPGLRALQKYAVRCGGGVNHRMSLGDAALIKDNHVAAAGSVRAAIRAVRATNPDIPLEVEVDNLDQFDEAAAAGAGLILLDNFSLADTTEAVRRRDSSFPTMLLESSGRLTLDRAAEVAAAGVDFLAIGALTHSVRVLDLGMDI